MLFDIGMLEKDIEKHKKGQQNKWYLTSLDIGRINTEQTVCISYNILQVHRKCKPNQAVQ